MKPTIGKTEAGKNLVIDIKRLLVTRMLIQASSGGGKSYALRRILEQTANHVQQVILDIEDEFTTLREKFDYVICAPQGADAIATPQTATILARRLRETRASAIIGMYEMKMPDRKKFVRLFLEEFVEAPKSMWHPCLVVVDEAHHFCPERDEAESMSAVNDLITRGRKRGLCGLLATQRLSKLSKDSAAELHNKLIGLAVLDTDVKRAADDLGMTMKESMPLLRALEPGEFFCFGPALVRTVTKIKVGPVVTTHPEAGAGKILAPPPPSAKIKTLLAKLTDLPKEAEQEARTLSDFKAENTRLKRELTTVQRQTDPAVIERAVKQERQKIEDWSKASNLKLQRQFDRLKAIVEEAMQFIVKITADETLLKEGVDTETMEKAMKKAVDEIRKQVGARFESQRRLLENYRRQGTKLFKEMEGFLDGARVPIDVSVSKQEPIVAKVMPHMPTARRRTESGDGEINLTPMDRAILTVLAQFEEGSRARKLVLLAGYTLNGSTRNSFSKLRSAGYILGGNTETMHISEEGINALGQYDPLPIEGDGLRSYWLNHSMLTPMDKSILRTLINHPDGFEAEPLCVEAGYTLNGSTRNSFSKLRTAGLIVGKNTETITAVQELLQ
jgi:hypothetical protein